MPTHDPLTPSQLALLDRLAHAPIVLTLDQQANSPEGRDMNFLMALGLVQVAPQHVSQDNNRSTWLFSRSAKPID